MASTFDTRPLTGEKSYLHYLSFLRKSQVLTIDHSIKDFTITFPQATICLFLLRGSRVYTTGICFARLTLLTCRVQQSTSVHALTHELLRMNVYWDGYESTSGFGMNRLKRIRINRIWVRNYWVRNDRGNKTTGYHS